MNDDAVPAADPGTDRAQDLLSVEEIARLSAEILERVASVVVGMSEALELALATILATKLTFDDDESERTVGHRSVSAGG